MVLTSPAQPCIPVALNTAASPPLDNEPAQPVKYRCVFSKCGPARFLSHLELSRCIARALRRARMPLQYSRGYHPLPLISFYDALPVGMESLEEVFDIELTRRIPAAAIAETVNLLLPQGLKIISSEEFILKKPPGVATMLTQYRVAFPSRGSLRFPSPDSVRRSTTDFLSQQEFFIQTRKGGSLVQIDVRPFVRSIMLNADNGLEVVMQRAAEKMPRMTEIMGDILQLEDRQRRALIITKSSSRSDTRTDSDA
jgi:radical SAM-linked protein